MASGDEKQAGKKDEDKGQILGFTKPKKFLFFKIKSKPIYAPGQAQPQPQQPQPQPKPQAQPRPQPKPQQKSGQPQNLNMFSTNKPQKEQQFATFKKEEIQKSFQTDKKAAMPGMDAQKAGKPNGFQIYIASVAGKHKDLEAALRAQNIKETPYQFVKKMFINAAIISAVVTIAVGAVVVSYGLASGPLLALLLGVACFYGLFNRFISYPLDRGSVVGNEIEKDILFATRDLVISMRSGMPLFNALTAVSTGYGAASQEFSKVVELVQLGTPIEQAIDEVSAKSKSRTFKRVMLQTTVSLKAGADVVGALQGVLDEVMQERVIELRRYGQRLNVLAMFYMLFGVIFPAMGVAVFTILTTFINIITITDTTLLFAAVGIFFLQLIFLNFMRSSRPVFAM